VLFFLRRNSGNKAPRRSPPKRVTAPNIKPFLFCCVLQFFWLRYGSAGLLLEALYFGSLHRHLGKRWLVPFLNSSAAVWSCCFKDSFSSLRDVFILLSSWIFCWLSLSVSTISVLLSVLLLRRARNVSNWSLSYHIFTKEIISNPAFISTWSSKLSYSHRFVRWRLEVFRFSNPFLPL